MRQEVWEEIKGKLLAEINSEPDSYHPQDVERLQSDPWFVERFLLDNKENAGECIKALKECLVWRKTYGVNDLKTTDFSKELLQIGVTILDLQNLVLYTRVKFHKKISEWTEYQNKDLTFAVNRMDQLANNKKWTYVFDLTDVPVHAFDFNKIAHSVTLLTKYFPFGLKNLIIYNVPWYFKPFYKMILALIPDKYREIIKLADRKLALELIGESNLPDFMGGNKSLKVDLIDECLSLEDIAPLYGIDKSGATKMRHHVDAVFSGSL